MLSKVSINVTKSPLRITHSYLYLFLLLEEEENIKKNNASFPGPINASHIYTTNYLFIPPKNTFFIGLFEPPKTT